MGKRILAGRATLDRVRAAAADALLAARVRAAAVEALLEHDRSVRSPSRFSGVTRETCAKFLSAGDIRLDPVKEISSAITMFDLHGGPLPTAPVPEGQQLESGVHDDEVVVVVAGLFDDLFADVTEADRRAVAA